MTRLRHQTITIDVTTRGPDSPWGALKRHLQNYDTQFVDFRAVKVGDIQDVTPNRERLIALAQWVGGEDAKRRAGLPSQWNQLDWLKRTDDDAGTACGTACCIAGKVALDDGAVPVFSQYDNASNQVVDAQWTQARVGTVATYVKFPDDDEMVAVREHAQSVLGLTSRQASQLFRGSNGLSDILEAIGDFLGDGQDDDDDDAEDPF